MRPICAVIEDRGGRRGPRAMRTLFSTHGVASGREFKAWREAICDRFAPVEQKQLDETVFIGKIQAVRLGSLRMTRVVQGALLTERTASTIRQDPKQDGFSVLIKARGRATVSHLNHDVRVKPGDIVVVDRARPALLTSTADSSSCLLEIPRSRLESDLGTSANFAGLLLDRGQAGVRLVRTFFEQFATVADSMDADAAHRMSAIGVDLLLAAIAERLGREKPQAVSGTLMVQRAKAHARLHLARPELDPHSLASAVGVSTRRLQELFQQRGHSIAEWIWQQRCTAAAMLLSDRGHAHLTISQVAQHCGFSSSSHFSRRFKEAHNVSPREFRNLVRVASLELRQR